MAAPLARLLKLRSLLEESSRTELQRRAALAARIEQAQQRTTEWSNAESAAWREQQLEPLAQATARRVADGREEFFERRKQRRQVESVLDAQRARIRTEQERRTQRDLDDWFGMKQARQRREAKETGRNPEKSLICAPTNPSNSGNPSA